MVHFGEMACESPLESTPNSGRIPSGIRWWCLALAFRVVNSMYRLFRPSCLVDRNGRPLWPYAPSSAEAIIRWICAPQRTWLNNARSRDEYPSASVKAVECAVATAHESLSFWLYRWWFWMWGCGILRRLVLEASLVRARKEYRNTFGSIDEYGHGEATFEEIIRRGGKLWW